MVKSYQERLNYLNTNLKSNIIKLYQHKEHQYQIQLTKLNSLNPLKTLEKGFGVITKEQKLIRSVSDVNLDDTIDIEIIDGTIRTKVIEKREKMEKNKSFEQLLTELEQIVKDLEAKDIQLETAIKKYQQGIELAKLSYKMLDEAQALIVQNADKDNE